MKRVLIEFCRVEVWKVESSAVVLDVELYLMTADLFMRVSMRETPETSLAAAIKFGLHGLKWQDWKAPQSNDSLVLDSDEPDESESDEDSLDM